MIRSICVHIECCAGSFYSQLFGFYDEGMLFIGFYFKIGFTLHRNNSLLIIELSRIL